MFGVNKCSEKVVDELRARFNPVLAPPPTPTPAPVPSAGGNGSNKKPRNNQGRKTKRA